MCFFVGLQAAFGHMRQCRNALVEHIPHAHGQMVPMSPMQSHALKAVAMMRAGLFAGTMIAALPHLLQKLLLQFPGFLLFPCMVQLVLPDRQLVAVNFHLVLASLFCGRCTFIVIYSPPALHQFLAIFFF